MERSWPEGSLIASIARLMGDTEDPPQRDQLKDDEHEDVKVLPVLAADLFVRSTKLTYSNQYVALHTFLSDGVALFRVVLTNSKGREIRDTVRAQSTTSFGPRHGSQLAIILTTL
eukprot:Transcript_29440.p2 GENE.Transcript_29440~~Transcript_29440.p2  ORF type:complete len:130 (-),score=21.02 Transcript_29440:773-1117(-)